MLWVVFFLTASHLWGNDPYFKNFTALDGLSSSEVYDITQDNMGYLWFATDRGLTRYDGTTFKRYTTSDGLLDNVIYNFFEMDDGTIWCSTSNHKLFYFKNTVDGFHPYKYNDAIVNVVKDKSLVINDIVASLNKEVLISFNASKGYLKIGVDGTVINKLRSESKLGDKYGHIWKIPKEVPNFIFKDYVDNWNMDSIIVKKEFESKSKVLFSKLLNFPKHRTSVGFVDGNYFFINEKNEIRDYTLPYNENGTSIVSGKYDEDLFWIGFQYGGVMLIDLQGNVKKHYLKEYSVSKIYRDHEGGIWVSTLNQGVFYCKQPLINFHNLESYPTELTQDNKEQLFVALHNGLVLKKDPNRNKFSKLYASKNKLPALVAYNTITDKLFYEEKNASVLVGEKPLGLSGVSDDEFPLLYGIRATSIRTNDKLKRLRIPNRVYDIAKKNDTYLIGTSKGVYSYKNDELKPLFNKKPNFGQRIFDIDYKYNTLYMGTMGKGIVIEKSDTIFSINKEQGLLSDICTEIFPEDKYTLWAGTNQGLNHITLYGNNTYEVTHISALHGLPCSEITDIEIIGNTVWIAAKEGLFSFPKQLLKEIKKKHKKWLHIEDFKINSEVKRASSIKTLAYNENNIDLSFNSVSFRNGKNREYRYKLNHTDSLWNYTGTGSVQLPNLSPGTYEFALQTKMENGSWTPSLVQSFVIATPFWKSWWFQGIIVIILGIIMFLSIKYRKLIFKKSYFNEIMVLLLRKLRREEPTPIHVEIKSSGRTIKLPTKEIGYFKSARNYIEIHTSSEKYLVRGKLINLYNSLPDRSEYVRLHQSYFVRIDQVVQRKGTKEVLVFNETIPVSKTYVENLKRFF